MTLRQLWLAWLLGPLALGVALVCAALWAPEPARRFDGAEVVVIGSSLGVHAMPVRFRLSDGRHVRRIGLSVPGEDELLTLFDAAIAERPQEILLEAAPFLADFAFEQPKGCQVPARGLRQALRSGQLSVVDRLRRLFGQRTSLDGMREPFHLNRAQEIDPMVMATFYPLTIHQPCLGERLERAVASAKAQGIRVKLIAYPRSPYGQARLGARQEQELAEATRQLAARLGLELLGSTAQWSDAEFTDHAHLNARGRARFMRELGTWLELPR